MQTPADDHFCEKQIKNSHAIQFLKMNPVSKYCDSWPQSLIKEIGGLELKEAIETLCEIEKQVDNISLSPAWKKLTYEAARWQEETRGWPHLDIEKSLSWKERIIAAAQLPASRYKTPLLDKPTSLWLHNQIELSDRDLAQVILEGDFIQNLTIEKNLEMGHQSALALSKRLSQYQTLALINCHHFDISEVNFEGSKLKSLSLKGLRKFPPLNNWSPLFELKKLDLSCSYLSDKQLVEAPTFQHLAELNLGSCRELGHFGLDLLKNFAPNLKKLSLDRCQGVHSHTGYELPSSITDLDLTWCGYVDDEMIDILVSRLNLRSLNLEQCQQISDESLEILEGANELEELCLNFCATTRYDALKRLLQRHPKLHSLHLKGLPIYENHSILKEFENLKALSLGTNPCLTPLLQAPYKLHYLDMGPCPFLPSNHFSEYLASSSASELKTLRIENAHYFNDDCLDALTSISSLRHLHLTATESNPQLFVKRFDELAKLQNLETLELSFSGICNKQAIQALLENLPNLKRLELGPIYKLSSQELLELKKAFPWIYITCYGYPNIKPF